MNGPWLKARRTYLYEISETVTSSLTEGVTRQIQLVYEATGGYDVT